MLSVIAVMALALGDGTQETSSRWLVVAQGENGTRVEIDRLSIVDDGGLVTLWVRHSLPNGREWIGSRRVESILQRDEYQCRQMLVATLSSAKYDAEGVALDIWNTQQPRYAPVIPETAGEAVWRAICGALP